MDQMGLHIIINLVLTKFGLWRRYVPKPNSIIANEVQFCCICEALRAVEMPVSKELVREK